MTLYSCFQLGLTFLCDSWSGEGGDLHVIGNSQACSVSTIVILFIRIFQFTG